MPWFPSYTTVRRKLWTGAALAGLIPALISASPLTGASRAVAAPQRAGGTSVTIVNVSGSLWTCSFNPFSASVNFLSGGILYEPLIYINAINNHYTPWLATRYAWSNNNKTLTFTIRNGVKWSDGKPLTSNDVAFTFNLIKKFPALDLNSVWSSLNSVSATGNQVIMQFKRASVPLFYYIADQVFIVPYHIWSGLKNPVTYTDSHPIGSGPYTVGSCSPQNISYTKNAHYWQPGLPKIDTVQYPAFMDNQPGNLYLAQGKGQWGGQYIPNVQAYYLNRDPQHRHIWYAPAGPLGIYVNLTQAPLNDVKVREAISMGIDRARVSEIGVYGYLPPGNQSMIILPNNASWYDKALAQKYNYSYNPSKAMAILKSDGYTRGSNGIFTKGGKPLSLSLVNVGGYTDWVAEVQVISSTLKQIGIDVKPENLSSNDYINRLQTGNFQLGYGGPTAGPTPYYAFRNLLYSANSAPIGKAASSNYDRFRNSMVDSILDAYQTTTNTAKQHQIVNQLQQVMLTQVPYIPVLEAVNWYQYDTTHISGWPTPSNPYANPAPYNIPDWEVVLLHLRYH